MWNKILSFFDIIRRGRVVEVVELPAGTFYKHDYYPDVWFQKRSEKSLIQQIEDNFYKKSEV